MGKLKTNELVDQFNKIRELKIVRGEYKNRTPYFRVTGTVNNDHIDLKSLPHKRFYSVQKNPKF